MNELKNKTVERFELIQMLRSRCFRQVAKENYIPCRQYPIMEYLMEHDGCSQIEMSKYFHISAAAITKSIDRLEKSNFVIRKEDKEPPPVSFFVPQNKVVDISTIRCYSPCSLTNQ